MATRGLRGSRISHPRVSMSKVDRLTFRPLSPTRCTSPFNSKLSLSTSRHLVGQSQQWWSIVISLIIIETPNFIVRNKEPVGSRLTLLTSWFLLACVTSDPKTSLKSSSDPNSPFICRWLTTVTTTAKALLAKDIGLNNLISKILHL